MLDLDEQLTLWCQFDTLVKLSFPVRLLDMEFQTKLWVRPGGPRFHPEIFDPKNHVTLACYMFSCTCCATITCLKLRQTSALQSCSHNQLFPRGLSARFG